MRLYEFADPSDYLLPEIGAAELLTLPETVLVEDTADDAVRRSRTRSETKNPTDTL